MASPLITIALHDLLLQHHENTPKKKSKVKSFGNHIKERDGFLTHEQLSITVAKTLCLLDCCSYAIGVWLSDQTYDKDAADWCPLISTLQH